jgi:hypothetical protein
MSDTIISTFKKDAAGTLVCLLPAFVRSRVDLYSDYIRSDGMFEVTLNGSEIRILMALKDSNLTVSVGKATWVMSGEYDEHGFWCEYQYPTYDLGEQSVTLPYVEFFRLREILPGMIL